MLTMSVPRVVAEFVGSGVVYTRSYPWTGTSETAIVVWLTEYEGGSWKVGDSHDPQGPIAVTKRLLFARWRYEADYLERGGRIVDAALSRQDGGQRS